MARTNKYTSINFNHILEKNRPPSSPSSKSSSPSYSSIASNNNNHGRMIVLARPTPKPKPLPVNAPSSTLDPQIADQPKSEPLTDQISLRPLGGTGTGLERFSPNEKQKTMEIGSVTVGSPKTGKFVPPHLRPGFVGKEEKPALPVTRSKIQKYVGSPGGYDRTAADMGLMNRSKSSGNRPTSS